MHLKRQKAPKNWPIKRKGSTYVVRPNSNTEKGLPLLVILRDILKLAQNRKEVKRILHEKQVLLNNKITQDEKNIALLFDIISILPLKKNYRLELSKNGKFQINETKESDKKIAKITNKKMLKGKKAQINLSDGRNVLSEINCKVNDSAVINFKEKKIEKCLAFKEKAEVIVFDGKHAGEIGEIEKIIPENKIAEVNIEGKKINILIKQLMVIK